jgi:hypothetical protein
MIDKTLQKQTYVVIILYYGFYHLFRVSERTFDEVRT